MGAHYSIDFIIFVKLITFVQMALVVTKKPYSRPESDEVIIAMDNCFAYNEKLHDNPDEYDWDQEQTS